MELSKEQRRVIENLDIDTLDTISVSRTRKSREQRAAARKRNRMRIQSAKIAGDIMRVLREKGISRKDFAEMLDVTPACVTRYLSGDANFQLDTLVEIQAVLGVQIFARPELNQEKTKVIVLDMPQSVVSPEYDSEKEERYHATIPTDYQMEILPACC